MPNVRVGVEAIGKAGVTAQALAAELGVAVRTVQRWAAGRHQPSKANGIALRELVDERLRAVLAGDAIADANQGAHLQRAKKALEPAPTPVQRQDLALLKASIIATMEAAKREPRRSVYADADPFALCRADSDMAEAIDAAFDLAAA